MMLYKYVPSPRFFSNFKFRFTPAEDLNDPKELVPDIRLRNPSSYIRDSILRNIEKAYFDLLLLHPELSLGDAWARCLGAAKQLETQLEPDTKIKEIYERFMRITNKNVGVLSLTKDPCNAVMWAHYAANYSGLAIGLDSDSQFFQPKPDEPRVCGQPMNVIYTDTSPVVFVDPETLDIPKEVFFTKARRWEYEEEWRMIKYLPQASEVLSDPSGKKIHLFAVPPVTIKEVIFGSKIDKASRDQVEQALQAYAPHVLRKEIRYVPGRDLEVVDC